MRNFNMQDYYKVGDTVTDVSFEKPRRGVVTKVNKKSIEVRYEFSKIAYAYIKMPGFLEQLVKI